MEYDQPTSGRTSIVVTAIAIILILGQAVAAPVGAQTAAPATCREMRECVQLANEAAERRDFETFHDLAWRAVQVGPRKDPSLMYLLARAQALSNHPHDALIMLQRLAEMGVATDAATNDDFRSTRALPAWPEVEAQLAGVNRDSTGVLSSASVRGPAASAASAPAPAASPPVSTTASAAAPNTAAPPSPPAAAASPSTSAGRSPASSKTAIGSTVEQAVRVPGPRFAPAGLAYDAVSKRFVIGDLNARKLMVVGDRADHAVDLVRADSAGFRDIAAIEIDGRRGDLWVVTAASPESDWTIHRMQLLSGRPLRAIHVAAELEPLRIIDVALSPSGTVWVLDAVGNRLLALRPGGTKLDAVSRLNVQGATSVASTADDRLVYVAHESGVSRVDLSTGAVVRVNAPRGVDLKRIERLRWHRNVLVAVQSGDDGTRRIVRFNLNAPGRAVAAAATLEESIPAAAGPTFATISGDEIAYVATEAPAAASSQPGDDRLGEFVIRRIPLP